MISLQEPNRSRTDPVSVRPSRYTDVVDILLIDHNNSQHTADQELASETPRKSPPKLRGRSNTVVSLDFSNGIGKRRLTSQKDKPTTGRTSCMNGQPTVLSRKPRRKISVAIDLTCGITYRTKTLLAIPRYEHFGDTAV